MSKAPLFPLRTLAVIGLCLALVSHVHGAARYLTRTWQSEDGLPSNIIHAIAQAADGYLWVGTAEGVVRFDGERFTGFHDSTGLTLEPSSIRAIYPLANGEVWVAAAFALFHGRGGTLEEAPLAASADAPAPVSQVVLATDGAVIIRRGAELWRYQGSQMTRLEEKTAAVEMLLQRDAEAEKERGHLASGSSEVRLRDAHGGMWQFKPGSGLSFTDPAGHTEPVLATPELPSTISTMTLDREGNLWLGTQTQGLWRVRPARVEMLTRNDGLSDQAVLVLLEDHAGALWVSTRGGGLDCRSADGTTWKHYEVGPPSGRRPVSALLETRAGVLWTATHDGQVYTWKNDGFHRAFPTNQGPGRILAMAEDERGQIWFGGHYGLSVLSNGKLRKIEFGVPEMVAAVVSAGGVVWVGTESGRVYRGTGDHFESAAEARAFGQHRISGLLPDADGSLWVATIGGGLFHLKGSQITAMEPCMTDVDPRMTCLLDDRAGYLWIGTLGGICRVEKAKLMKDELLDDGALLMLDRSDGLLTRECTRGGQPAGWRGRDGALFFSTGNGVASVHPERLKLNSVQPQVVIEHPGSRPGHPFPELRFGPGRSRLEFHYSAITFTAPEKVRFHTRLVGLDDQWRDVGALRSVVYESVPPGRYWFRVAACNGDGIWNDTSAVAIMVTPYYWQTLPFKIAAAAVAGSLTFGVGALISRARWRGRMLRIEAETSRQQERARIARDLHDQVGANLTQISLLAEFANTPQGLAELVETTREAAEALDSVVWAVDPRKDTLENLLQYLVRIAEDFLRRARIRCRIDVPSDAPPRDLSPDFRHHVLLIVKEALNNAAKYAAATEVEFAAKVSAEALELTISDNGQGFDQESRTEGNGLRNMQERAAALGGSCEIKSSAGAGTRVSLRIPWPGATSHPVPHAPHP